MPNEKKERRIKKHKRKAKKLQFTLIIIIVLACILAYYFDFLQDFSLDPGTEVSQDNNTTSVSELPNNTNKDNESDTDASYTEIRIKEEIIIYEGDVLTLEELNNKLQNKSNESTIIRLVDNISIHATFTSVEDLLKELDLKYIIIEDGNL